MCHIQLHFLSPTPSLIRFDLSLFIYGVACYAVLDPCLLSIPICFFIVAYLPSFCCIHASFFCVTHTYISDTRLSLRFQTFHSDVLSKNEGYV